MAEALTAAPRFEMRGVRKAFGATVALDGVDLAVRGGEVSRSSARTVPARARSWPSSPAPFVPMPAA